MICMLALHIYLFWCHNSQSMYCSQWDMHTQWQLAYIFSVNDAVLLLFCVVVVVYFFQVYTIWVGVISLHYGSAVLCWYSLAVHNSWRRHFYAHTSWSKTWISDKEVVSWVMLNKRTYALQKLIYVSVLVLDIKNSIWNANKHNK